MLLVLGSEVKIFDDIFLDEKSANFDADDIDNDLYDGEDLLSVDNSSDINNMHHNLMEQNRYFGA